VKDAALKRYPEGRITACGEEGEGRNTQFEVKLTTKDSKAVELDISPQGSLLQTEEKVDVASVPSTVISAFRTKYPSTKATAAEKQTKADGSVTYELGFSFKGKKLEATFGEDGTFRGEE
jgi:hypothetical protein